MRIDQKKDFLVLSGTRIFIVFGNKIIFFLCCDITPLIFSSNAHATWEFNPNQGGWGHI
jgi:hypothetical protein